MACWGCLFRKTVQQKTGTNAWKLTSRVSQSMMVSTRCAITSSVRLRTDQVTTWRKDVPGF